MERPKYTLFFINKKSWRGSTQVRSQCRLCGLHGQVLSRISIYCRVRNCTFFLLSFDLMVTDRKQSVQFISAFSYLPIFHIPLAIGLQTAEITLQRLCSGGIKETQQQCMETRITKIRRLLCVKLQELQCGFWYKIWLCSGKLTKHYVASQPFLLDFVISEMQDNSN